MMDIIFISYDEPNADENWEKLLIIAPHAHRVHGVKGIANAHIAAAEKVMTSNFFTVDGDNVVDENFDWDRVPNFERNDKSIHIWSCRNPVNGLTYGYGGVKLWPTKHIENIKEYSVDFTTSVAKHGIKVHDKPASTTHFNTSPFMTWRSAYRECVKLASGLIENPDERTQSRLLAWMSLGEDVKFGDICIHGARIGAMYGYSLKDAPEELAKINDFDWLKESFEANNKYYKYDYLNYAIPNIIAENFSSEQSKMIKEWIKDAEC